MKNKNNIEQKIVYSPASLRLNLMLMIAAMAIVGCDDSSKMTVKEQQQYIEEKVNEKVFSIKGEYEKSCNKRIMEVAIPRADSLIAEMFTAPIKEAYKKPEKPEKPEMPVVEIPDFPTNE